MKVADPIWFITGASSGLGRALAQRVLGNGQRAVVTARHEERVAELVANFPETCRALTLDVADAVQVQKTIAEAAGCFGRLDVVVNNAGYGVVGALEELSGEQIARNFQTNFFGAVAVIRAALPALRAQKSGHLVNVSAAAAIGNYPGFSIYGATKWALEGLSESLDAELKPLGIRVTLVEPGPFRTEFVARSLERAATRIEDYDRTSGKFLRLIESMNGKQPGDPARAAAAIIAAVSADDPPLRLVLGKYATDKVRKKSAATLAELARWEAVGAPTEFSPAP